MNPNAHRFAQASRVTCDAMHITAADMIAA